MDLQDSFCVRWIKRWMRMTIEKEQMGMNRTMGGPEIASNLDFRDMKFTTAGEYMKDVEEVKGTDMLKEYLDLHLSREDTPKDENGDLSIHYKSGLLEAIVEHQLNTNDQFRQYFEGVLSYRRTQT